MLTLLRARKIAIFFTFWQTKALSSKGNRQYLSLFGSQKLYRAREIANFFHFLAVKSSIEQGKSPISFTFWQSKALSSKGNRQFLSLFGRQKLYRAREIANMMR
jgi:hypothetical protein